MKSKLFCPEHYMERQSPLGTPSPDSKCFANTQDVPQKSTFGDASKKAVPATPYRSK